MSMSESHGQNSALSSMVKPLQIAQGRQGVFQVTVFKFILLLSHGRYNHAISTVDAETSSKVEDIKIRKFLQHVTILDSITRIHF